MKLEDPEIRRIPPATATPEADVVERVDEHLKRCLDRAAEGLHWVASDGTLLWANQTELELLGYSGDEYIGRHIADFHVDRPVIEDILARLTRRETLLNYGARLRHKDGSIRYVQINSKVLWDGDEFLRTQCFTRDVTDQRVAHELARRLAEIVENSDDAIISQDLNGTVTSWNSAAERLYGYEAAEALGQPIRVIVPAHLQHEEEDVVRRVRRGERVPPFDTQRKHKDGTLVDVALAVSPVRDQDGVIVGASKMARDISARKRMEAKDAFLVALDDLVRPLTDAEDITFTAAKALGQHLSVNRCAYAIVEDDEDTIVLTGNFNDGVESIVGRYTLTQFGTECLRLMRAGEPYIVTDSHTDPRISETHRASYAMTAIRGVICVPILKECRLVAAMAVHTATPRHWRADEVQLVQRVAGRCWESIERAKITQSLEESEHLFRALANSIPNLTWMARPDGWIYWYNEQWYDYTGTTPEQMQGWGWQDVHDSASLPDVTREWQRSIATGTPFEMVFPLRGADGQFRRFLTRVNPVRDSRGEVVHWFGTNTDVEAERRATEANDSLREAAETANRAKDEFLAMLGHELRNPLSPILTALQLMRLRGSDESQRERTIIERQVRHLTRLVDDLLDVSRIARGKVELKRETVEMAEIVAAALEMTSPLLEQRTHSITVKLPRRGLAVEGDATRLSQVVSNLITNAAKYTPSGGSITISGEAVQGEVILSVRDTGVGIAPEVLPRIFDLFIQGAQAIDRSQGGLGLGLTIVRNLVERHGGSVSARSDGAGTGAEFVIRLPRVTTIASVHRQDTGVAVHQGAAVTGGRRILVVDDNEDSALMLSEVLKVKGYQTRTAHDAPAALLLAAEFCPELAFLDIGLPVMDGYELAALLRQIPSLKGIRLIALTGYGQESDRQRTAAAGFERHLVKPVDLAVVEEIAAHETV